MIDWQQIILTQNKTGHYLVFQRIDKTMTERKISNALYYFPKGKQLIVLSLILLSILTIILLEYYKGMIEFVCMVTLTFIPFGLLLIPVVFIIIKSQIKIHLWILYIGVIFLLTLISEGVLFNAQIHDSIQKSAVLIDALEQYKKDSGVYPKELDALKGKYLEQIPNTTIGVFSTQEYYYSSYNGKFELFIYDHFLNLGGVHLYNSDYPERGWYYDD